MNTEELIKQRAVEKLAGFGDFMMKAAPIGLGAVGGALNGVLQHTLMNPPSERLNAAAALNGAISGMAGGVLGLGYPNLGASLPMGLLGGTILGGTAGSLTKNMTQRWMADKQRMDEINNTLASPFLDPSTREELMNELEAIKEMEQEDLGQSE